MGIREKHLDWMSGGGGTIENTKRGSLGPLYAITPCMLQWRLQYIKQQQWTVLCNSSLTPTSPVG